MSTLSNRGLDGSWVVEHGHSDVETYEQQTSDSDGAAEYQAQNPKTPQKYVKSYRSTATPSTGTIPSYNPSSVQKSPEPDFIMPTIGLSSGLRGNAMEALNDSSPIRKRSKESRDAYNQSSRSTRRSDIPPPHKTSSPRKHHSSQDQDLSSPAMDKAIAILAYSAEWLLDTLGNTLKLLKKPISWILAAYLFAGLLIMAQNLLTQSIYSAFSPICRVPGISLLGLPMCRYAGTTGNVDAPTISPDANHGPVEFDSLMKTQAHFEEILSDSAAGVALPFEMKQSETSIRDLRQIVRFSYLPSKNELVLEFDGFIETARIASYDLQKFNSHVGRGVDIVLSTARWTQRVLDDISIQKSSRGIVPAFLLDTVLKPFRPLQFTEARLLDQYIQHTRVISDEIEKLISEAQALLLTLQNLEDRLDVIHSISLRDNLAAQGSKDEALSHLWTLLGGNRAKLGKYNKQLTLLRQVGDYRRVAFAHVSATIIKLQAMGAELEELRTRVGSAELLKDHSRDIPLRVHLDAIRLGVERLETGREKAKEIEKGHVRRVLGPEAATEQINGYERMRHIA